MRPDVIGVRATVLLDAVVQERRIAARLKLLTRGSPAYRPLYTAHAVVSEQLARAMDQYVAAVNAHAQGRHPESKTDA
jgi:hypothetical protein